MRRRALLLVLLLAAAGTFALALSVTGGGWFMRAEGTPPDRRDEEEHAGSDPPPAPPPARGEPEAAPLQNARRLLGLSGIVRDSAGRPIPGAHVNEAVTGADGRYELAEAPVRADVWAEGFLPQVGLQPEYGGPGPWRCDFALEPAAVLEGYVRTQAGQPVERARVYVIDPRHAVLDRSDLTNTTVTGADGRFAFPGLPAGVMDLGARAEGFLPALVRDVEIPKAGVTTRDMTLVPGRTLRVHVEVPDLADLAPVGDRVPRQETTVQAADSRLRDMLLPPGGAPLLANALVGRGLVDLPVVEAVGDFGDFVLGGVGPGPADVAAHRPGYLPAAALDSTEPDVHLKLIRGTAVAVAVTDAVDGSPLEPAITRESDGEFVPFEGLLPSDRSRHVLRFELAGYAAEETVVVDPEPGRVVAVAMQPLAEGETGILKIRIEPEVDGRMAVVGREVSGERNWVRHPDLGEDAAWHVDGVPSGTWDLTVLVSGMIPARLPGVVVTRGVVREHVVQLTAGGGLDLEVTDASGTLLDKVWIVLKDGAGNQIDVNVISKVSDERGFVSVNYLPSAAAARADSGLAAGTYTLVAGREGYQPATKEFTITGTEVAEVDLALTKPPQ